MKDGLSGGPSETVSVATVAVTNDLTVADTLTVAGVVTANGGVTLGAGDDLIGSATSDITFNTNKFTVAGATGDTVVAGTLGVTGLTTLTGGATTGVANSDVPVVLSVAQQALSDAGAVNVTSFYTAWTTTGAAAGTLADGAVVGQLKKVQLIVTAGDGTLTPSNLSGGTTITFADAGDFALLIWDGTNWVAIELGNAADGATAPVLA